MSDPDRPVDAGPDDLDAEDAQALADHDPQGIDLATQIAHQTAAGGSPSGGVNLPPSKGVRPRRKRRPSDPTTRSGSGPDERDPQTVGSVFDNLVQDRGWTKQLSVRTLLGRWADLVGEDNANHTTPEAYQDGVLTIRADSTTWATSLRMIQTHLIAKLNAELGDGTVTKVTILGPSAPSWKRGPRSVRDGRGPRDTYG
ncbi:DUF721 domain-containing protein [Aestuariimicrobium ganziense]|uniref:DUF721 domain-containing protein n=1 Tax=Aestuariimicrobium ganziense TaxID=2773677 RepID=UPI0019446752|nr:DciA family protein [Aestuariimicrobium ganziense]